jgi:hypothetical protein
MWTLLGAIVGLRDGWIWLNMKVQTPSAIGTIDAGPCTTPLESSACASRHSGLPPPWGKQSCKHAFGAEHRCDRDEAIANGRLLAGDFAGIQLPATMRERTLTNEPASR